MPSVAGTAAAQDAKAALQELKSLAHRWLADATKRRDAHQRAAETLGRTHYTLGIPTVAVSAIVGSALFATTIRKELPASVQWAATALGFLAVVLSALQTFLRLHERCAKHESARLGYDAMVREIELQVVMLAMIPTGELRQSAERLGETITKRFDELGKLAPEPATLADGSSGAAPATPGPLRRAGRAAVGASVAWAAFAVIAVVFIVRGSGIDSPETDPSDGGFTVPMVDAGGRPRPDPSRTSTVPTSRPQDGGGSHVPGPSPHPHPSAGGTGPWPAILLVVIASMLCAYASVVVIRRRWSVRGDAPHDRAVHRGGPAVPMAAPPPGGPPRAVPMASGGAIDAAIAARVRALSGDAED